MLLKGPQFHNDFPHIRQQHRWDCGIACVAMVMEFRSRSMTGSGSSCDGEEGGKLEFYRILNSLQNDVMHGFGYRPWTIDLCHILHSLKVPYQHFTSHPGLTVNDNLSKLKYYSSASFKQDAARIARLLRRNTDLASHVTPTIPYMEDTSFLQFLEAGPLLLLTDGNLLRCKICLANNKLKWIVKSLRSWGNPNGFIGHYILVLGWKRTGPNSDNVTVYYRDPGVSHELCVTKLKHLSRARHAFGTDGDMIAIKLKPS